LTDSSHAFGFLNALKPPGTTSTAFGGWLRRLLGGAPVGHWGTLDPAACGVLVLAVGAATRLLPLIAPAHKQYVFEMRFGTATDTGDASGRVIEHGEPPAGWRERLPAEAAALVGPLEQVPPMFSAVKVAGRPLYLSARRGQQIARAARTTHVLTLRVLEAAERSARLLVDCEAGLYVRTLCEQIGARLGVPAHMGWLVRTAAGPFSIAHSKLPQDIHADPAGCLIDPLAVLAQPRVALDGTQALRFQHGNGIATTAVAGSGETAEVLVLHGEKLIGVGSLAAGALSPLRVFDRGGERI
jgi:tRNA pseudouridine55 synthase